MQNVFAVYRSAQGAADWRPGPRWSATSMLYLVHPFASSRHFPSRGNKGYEEKTGESYTSRTISAFSPFGGWRHHLSAPLGSVSLDSQSPTVPCESSSLATSSRGYYKPVLTIESHMGRLPRGALLSTVHILHRMCKSGEVRRLACP